MPFADLIQTNFTAGELSPLMYGRVDFNKYKNGVKRLQNFLVKPQGGAVRRPGTQFVDAARQSGMITPGWRLKDFTFSAGQAYSLEFTDQTMRIYTAGGRVESPPGTPVEVATPWLGGDVSEISFAQSADVIYCACPGYPPQVISRLSNTSWTCAAAAFVDGPYLDAPDPDKATYLQITQWDYTLGTPAYVFDTVLIWSQQNIFVTGKWVEYYDEQAQDWRVGDVGTTGSGGGFYNGLAAINTAPVFQLPADQTAFTFSGTWPTTATSINITSPYSVFSSQNIGNLIRVGVQQWGTITAIVSASVATVTSLAMSSYDHNKYSVSAGSPNRQISVTTQDTSALFSANDVGRWIRVQLYGQWVPILITTYVTATYVKGTPFVAVPYDTTQANATNPGGMTNVWRLGAWRVDATLGACYPACVGIHQGRLWFGGSPDQPMTFWGSRGDDYLVFRPTEYDAGATVVDDDAITATIADGQIDTIRWIISGLYMMVGTGGAEYLVNAGITSAAITPTTITVTKQSQHGSSSNRAFFLDLSFIHIDRTGTRLDEMTYQYLQNSYVTTELTMLAEHLFTESNTSIIDLALQRVPTQIIWALGSDGSLYGCTRLRDQDVAAWHRHPLYNGKVLAMCVIPSSSGMADTLYLAVQRTINGSSTVYIEILTPEYRATGPTDITNQIFCDCSLSYSGSATSTLTGINHLIGETVQVVANGIFVGTAVVSNSGTVAVPSGTTTAHVGYSINSQILTLNTEGGNPQGSSQGRLSRVQAVILRLYQAVQFFYGVTGKQNSADNTALVAWQYGPEGGGVYSPPQLKTGDARVDLQQQPSRDNGFTISQTNPYPLTVSAIISDVLVDVP